MLQYIVILSVFLQLFGIFFYIKDTLCGLTKPNRITWFMWGLTSMIGVAAALSDGVRWAVLPIFIGGLVSWMVFLASFVNPHAYWKLNTFDYLCGVFSFLAIILWYITKEPTVAIILSIVSDFFATLPTFIKTWKYPETEQISAYIVGALSG